MVSAAAGDSGILGTNPRVVGLKMHEKCHLESKNPLERRCDVHSLGLTKNTYPERKITMPETKLTINSKTLFPIEHLREHLKEALKIARDLSPAIITQHNRPAYAIVRLDEAYPTPKDDDKNDLLADQIKAAQKAANGTITFEPYWWEKL